MFSTFFESLESRSLLSASIPSAMQSPGTGVATAAVLHAAPKAAKAPTAKLSATTISSALSSYTFKVTYKSAANLVVSSIKTGNLIVSGPNGYKYTAKLVSVSPKTNAKSIVATYSIAPTSGSTFTSAGNGTYTVTLAAKSVKDAKKGTNAKALTLGTFKSAIGGSVGSAASLVGTYNGTLIIPAVNHYRNLVITIASQDSTGRFTGSMVADGLVQLSVSGTVSAGGAFTFNFATPSSGTPHIGGAISGTGSGTGAGTSSVAVKITATASGISAPGTITATKA